MNEATALRRFYDILAETEPGVVPWEEWRGHATENAELWPIEGGGQMVGGILWKGHTVHIAVLPAWRGRWIRRSHLRAWDTYTHDVDIYATPPAADANIQRLLERLGFRRQMGSSKLGVAGVIAEQYVSRAIYVKERTTRVTTEELCLQP